MITPAPPETTQRRRELQDWLNRELYHPLAYRLARLLARTPVTPDQVSILGALCVIAAGFAYVRTGWALSVPLGLLLHMAWHVVDGADGDLARMTGRSSPFGETVDGLSDYLGHIALYLMLGSLLAERIGPAGWLVMVAAGVSRIVQTNHFEVQRRRYQWLAYGTDWVGSSGIDEADGRRGAIGRVLDVYLGLAAMLSPATPRTDAALLAASEVPARLGALRQLAHDQMLKPLGKLTPLGSNPRTLALGLSMLAGSPLWYFLYEATLLNLVLALSIRRHRRAASRLEAAVAQLGESSLR
jgi:phosphatidylglycerophosphate synthase